MSNLQVPFGQFGFLSGIRGAVASGQTAPVTGATATVDDYTSAFLAPGANPGEVYVIPKSGIPAGGKATVSVVFHGQSFLGATVASTPVALDLVGPPVPPEATQMVVGAPAARTTVPGSPTDPGSPTIDIAV